MTKATTISTYNSGNGNFTTTVNDGLSRMFDPLFIGFDRFFDSYSSINTNSYPPYNVIKVDEETFMVEIAVAGFGKDDLEITEDGGVLKIIGNSPDHHESHKYLHKGIAARKFVRMFNLHDDVEVKSADIHKGLLQIILKRNIPEHKKPKRISIGK